MSENHFSTQEFIMKRIDELEDKLQFLEEEKTATALELQKTNKALDVFREKNKQLRYEKTAPLKDKILYCFTTTQHILPICDVVDILTSKDPELKNQHDFDESIRRTVKKLIDERLIVPYRTSKMKNFYYALKTWTDDIGEVYSRFL